MAESLKILCDLRSES